MLKEREGAGGPIGPTQVTKCDCSGRGRGDKDDGDGQPGTCRQTADRNTHMFTHSNVLCLCVYVCVVSDIPGQRP